MKKLRTVVFGAGFVGRVHIEGVRRLGNVELYAIGVGPDDDGPRRRLASLNILDAEFESNERQGWVNVK